MKTGPLAAADAARRPDPARVAAADPAASPRALWLLALRCRDRAVHRELAANPSAPRGLLWYLAHFGRWDVRAAVALNSRCGSRVQRWLCYVPDWAVQAALASSPATPPGLLSVLVEMVDPRVSLAAATNPALPADLVEVLLKRRNVYARGAAASNPNAPADSLRQLARGMSEPAWVLRAIAANPSCPPDLSDQLLTWIALGGEGDADPMFDPVACTGHPGDTQVALFSWYADKAGVDGAERHPLWRVRAAVGRARRTLKQPVLAQLRRDHRPEVRRSVAGFVPVPIRAIRELMGDADAAVARTASQVRKQNRRLRARRSLRLAPLAALAAAALLPVLHSASPQLGHSHGPSAVIGPGTRLPSCDSAITLSQASTGGAVLPEVGGPPAVSLPGGGWLACGPLAAGDRSQAEALVLSAGSRGFGLLAHADAVELPDGKHYRNVRLHVPPGHKAVLAFPSSPQQVIMEISPDGMRAKVITVYLFFGPAA